jgi:hypothetical protein
MKTRKKAHHMPALKTKFIAEQLDNTVMIISNSVD